MIVEFAKAVALLLALCLIQGFITRRWSSGELVGRMVSGMLFGGISVIGMMTPIEITPGVIFDARSVVLAMSGLFGGPMVGGIAAVIAGGYRLWLGGGGAIVGVSVIVSSVLLGLAYRYGVQRGWLRTNVWQLLVLGLVVHLFEIYLFTFLPGDVVAKVMENIAIPLVLTFTPATALLGCLLQSIEAQIKISRSLEESEARFRQVTENINEVFWMTDSEKAQMIYISPAYENIWGRSCDSLYQHPLSFVEAIHPDDRDRIVAAFEKQPSGEYDEEYRIQKPDGQIRWIRDRAFPVRNKEGRVYRIVGVADDITDRKRAEEARLETEVRFRDFAELGAEWYWEMDSDLRYSYVSPTYPHYSGRYREKLIGRTRAEVYAKVLPKLDQEEFEQWQKFNDLVESRKTFHDCETKWVNSNDEVRYFVTSGKPIYRQDGAFGGYRGVGSDITERKQAASAYQKSEARLRGAVDSLQEAFVLFDADDRVVAMNVLYRQMRPNAARFLEKGLRFEDLIRDHVKDGLIVEAIGREEEFIRERMEQHRNPGPPILRRGIDGRWAIINETRTPEGGVALTFFDITDLKRAEEAAKKSEARLAEILAIAPEAVITIGADMNIQLFNQGAERIFGYRAGEVVGRSMDMLLPDRFRERHGKHIEGFDRSPGTYRLMDQRQEIAGLRKDGGEFPASASVSKVEIDGEKIFTVMLHDVSERNQAAEERRLALEEARRANAAKSEFLAAMSHELRTPLNAILGFADIISHQYVGPVDEKYQEYAEDIHTSGEHLLSLINDVLDISSIEAGKRTLTKEDLIIAELVAESVEIVAHETKKKNIDMTTDMAEGLPPLHADRRAVRQIVLNLLGNAVKFTPEGGKITVSAQASKTVARIRVADTGFGIPPEKIPELTNPFTRADRDPHKAVDGWGLGLAITKSLIDLHGGKLEIKSKLGAGTTVTVTLPTGKA